LHFVQIAEVEIQDLDGIAGVHFDIRIVVACFNGREAALPAASRATAEAIAPFDDVRERVDDFGTATRKLLPLLQLPS